MIELAVDDREPAKLRGLVENRAREAKITTTTERLDAGDFAFVGLGPGDVELYIGVERKTWSDLLASLVDHRARDQIRKMAETYDVRYLLIEGEAGTDDWGGFKYRSHNGEMVSGAMAFQSRRWTFTGVMGVIETLRFQGDFRLLRSKHMPETSRIVTSLAHWWSKPWSEHSTLNLVHPLPSGPLRPDSAQVAMNFGKVSNARRVAAAIPGFGWKYSKRVDEHFESSVRRMANAEAAEWQEIKGVGPTLAKNAVRFFNYQRGG